MASNKRGSCDPSVSKMLCLHVPSLLPPSFLPMDLASPVQAAAVAGIGLLYQGSSHRLMTEFLLSEMGRQPAKDQNSNDRESFALVGLIFCDLCLIVVAQVFLGDAHTYLFAGTLLPLHRCVVLHLEW